MSLTNYMIEVQTGDIKSAGTSAKAFIVLHGEDDQKSVKITLNQVFEKNFKRGSKERFWFMAEKFLGKIKFIEIRRGDGLGATWFVDNVTVTCTTLGETFVFPILRWIESSYSYRITLYDTSLPQDDQFSCDRANELKNIKKTYKIVCDNVNLPARVKDLPEDEKFSFSYTFDLGKRFVSMKKEKCWNILKTGNDFESLDEFDHIYTTTFGVPYGMQRWKSDFFFGWQRVSSVSYSLISLCTEIPDKLGVTDEMVSPLLEGLTLHQAIDTKRLFIIDLEVIKDMPTKSEEFHVPAPIALFFLNYKKDLMPVAIQLHQEKSDDNPVFLPTDPSYTWIVAKMWYNLADATFHQSLTHLGLTHLVMEGFCLAMHRNLSISHPLFKLMAPHFLYLLAINTSARKFLINPGGVLDVVMGSGTTGAHYLIEKMFPNWRIDIQGTLPEDIKRRGVDDPDVLPNYYYRDDGLLLYDCIKKYVTNYVNLYYDDKEKILKDYELQNYGAELVKQREDGGLGFKGIANDGKFETVGHIVSLVTSAIYTCSVAHAATNFPQYDEYGFPPNYPLELIGKSPKNKDALSESDVVAALPSKSVVFDLMIIVNILSQKGTQSLGDFEVDYIYDPPAVEIVERFREDLSNIAKTVEERNSSRIYHYAWLNPKIVPNSTSI